MQNVSGASLTQPLFQQTMDYFTSSLTLPASKLDADQYVAEDIDGVTESLFGSGNLNFLVMQSGQTNGVLASIDPFSLRGETFSGDARLGAGAHGGGAAGDSANELFRYTSVSNGVDGAQSALSGGPSVSFAQGGSIGSSLSSALATSPDSAGFTGGGIPSVFGGNGLNGLGLSGSSGLNGSDGTAGAPGHDGSGGYDGTNGTDGNGGGETTIINIEVNPGDTIINLGDVIVNLGDINLGDIIVDIGDILNVDLCDVTNIITTVITEVTTIVSDVTTIITDVTNNVTNIVSDVTNNVTDIVTNVTDIVQNILGDGLTLELDAVLGNVTGLDLSVISGDTVLDLVDSIIDLSPVTNLLEPVIDLDGLILADISSIFSLLHDGGHGHAPGDTDLGIGLDTFLGDLPLLNGVTDIVFNPIEDLIGDIDVLADIGLGLFDNSNIDNNAGDTDITLDLGLGLLDGTPIGGAIDIPFDPVEQVLGDIDLDLGAATNLLGQTAQGIVDEFAGGSGAETLLSGIGGGLAGLGGGLLPGIGGDGGHDDVTADIDLGLFNHDLVDLDVAEALDVIEPLVGDVDLASGVGLDLLGDHETSNKAGDTDIDLDLDINLLGMDIVEIDFIDVPLDPLEAILGDIDINLNAALDLLNPDCNDGGVADLLHNNGGGDGLLAWTENLLPDLGGLLGHDIDHGLGSILPAPVGDIAEGLGGLLGGESSGGLFGGGGLFG